MDKCYCNSKYIDSAIVSKCLLTAMSEYICIRKEHLICNMVTFLMMRTCTYEKKWQLLEIYILSLKAQFTSTLNSHIKSLCIDFIQGSLQLKSSVSLCFSLFMSFSLIKLKHFHLYSKILHKKVRCAYIYVYHYIGN